MVTITENFENEDNIEVIDLTSSIPEKGFTQGNAAEKQEPLSSVDGDNFRSTSAVESWISEVGQEHLLRKVKDMEIEWEKLFYKGAKFETTSSLREHAQEFAGRHDFIKIVTKRHREQQDITLTCKHGGQYRNHHKKSEGSGMAADSKEETKKVRKRKSMKTDCPCLIYAKYDLNIKKVEIMNSVFIHNHPLAEDPRTYAVNRKLDANKFELAQTLLKTNKPATVLKVIIILS